jgi:hypothetical protein
MSICREQDQQGFVLHDDLVEQNHHSIFSASGEEKTEQEQGRLPGQARSFINASSAVMRHTKPEMLIRIRTIVRSWATTGWPNNLWL